MGTCPVQYLAASMATWDFPGSASGKEPACQRRRRKRGGFNLREDPLEKGMATQSSILAWRISCTEEPVRLTVHRVTKSWT